MFGKSIKEVNYEDIVDLVEIRKEQEGLNLDYKENIQHKRFKKEICKDVSSFANSAGGFIIIGITDNLKIVGIERTIYGRKVDEWLNQVLSSQVEPIILYKDPKLIEIPNSDNILLLLEIPESKNKPHFAKEDYAYYLRINDSSKKASHFQIRDMFENKYYLKQRFKEFVKNRYLDNPLSNKFGHYGLAAKITNNKINSSRKKIFKVIFNIIPVDLNFFSSLDPLIIQSWIDDNYCDIEPYNVIDLFKKSSKKMLTIDGVKYLNVNEDQLISFFEVQLNGFIESCQSQNIVDVLEDESIGQVFVYLNLILGYQSVLLNWTKSYYKLIGYYGDFQYQLSIVESLGWKLKGLSQKFDSTRYDRSKDRFCAEENLKIAEILNVSNLSKIDIKNIEENTSLKLCRVFGLDKNYGYDNNQNINMNYLNDI